MSIQRLLGGALIAGLFSTAATAQTYDYVVEPIPQADQLSDNVRGQFIRAGDVSPEEYARLLAEADKIRAYQGQGYATQDYSTQEYTTTVYSAPSTTYQSTGTYDGRPSNTVTTAEGYQIELYDTPVQAPVTQTATYSTSSGYTVVRGDTLYGISRRHGVSLSELKSRNGLSGNTISIGQVLTLPGQTASYSQSYTAPSQAYTINSQPLVNSPRPTMIRNVEPIPFSGVYAVLPGDTLYSIARRACVSVDEVSNINGLGGSTIQPGQRLTMPNGHCLN